MFEGNGQGFHHQAVFCADYEAQRDALVTQGFAVASEFSVPCGAKICYVDTRSALGHMIELYPPDGALKELYRQTRDASQGWDRPQLMIAWAR
jgi:hypothetical protein